jgi:hypothetical protein
MVLLAGHSYFNHERRDIRTCGAKNNACVLKLCHPERRQATKCCSREKLTRAAVEGPGRDVGVVLPRPTVWKCRASFPLVAYARRATNEMRLPGRSSCGFTTTPRQKTQVLRLRFGLILWENRSDGSPSLRMTDFLCGHAIAHRRPEVDGYHGGDIHRAGFDRE